MKQRKLCVLTTALVLTGCSSVQPIDKESIQQIAANTPQAAHASLTQEATPAISSALEDERFLAMLEKEMANCEAKAEALGLDSANAKKVNLGIAALGIVAGSIVVPALAASGAAKSVVAAWGGVSGAANAAQLTLNTNGQSPEATANTQKQFASNVKTVMDQLKTLQPGQAAAAFIYELRLACTIGTPIENLSKPPSKPVQGWHAVDSAHVQPTQRPQVRPVCR